MDGLVFPDKIQAVELGDTYGKIVISPLERGMATTLGNGMRRTLLSSIPGAAVVRVMFAGKYHEYDTIDGVQEDILEIILNIKSIALRAHGEDVKRLTLEKSGPCEVTAADLVLPPGVEIINPDLLLATLNGNGVLELELEVETGYGYRPSELNKLSDGAISVIPIDADFSPVRKVNFTVEETRVGGLSGYERLTMEVSTNGGIRPEEAISEAAKILSHHLSMFSEFAAHPFGVELVEETPEEDSRLSVLLTDLDVDPRACNLLREAEIVTLGDLLSRPREELLDIHGFGAKTLGRVEERLRELDYELRSEEEMRDAA